MQQPIRLADGLTLPLDVVTQSIGVLAKRRAGKSYLARRFTEQLLHAGQQVVIVDPKGDWWGIRSAADGRRPGLPVVIVGGERGDVPLEASGGEVVAKLVVEERLTALLDLGSLRKHEVATFMTAFLEGLYRLKAREEYRTPVMLVIDEADAVAPQKPMPGEQRMLGAAEDIVRRGGQRGIGCTLITQRSAVLNKNVLTQVQAMIALRTIAPQDLKAMDAWIDVHGTPEQRRALMDSLPSLPVGDAWVWSPGWPTGEGIFQRVHVLPIETFDSGATPRPGEQRAEPKRLADVDLDAIRRQMSETIERAKADDPRELKRQIAEMRKQLAEKRAAPVIVPKPERIEVPVLKDGQLAKAVAILDRLESIAAPIREAIARVSAASVLIPQPRPERPPLAGRSAPIPQRIGRQRCEPADGQPISGPEQRILDALAWFESIGVTEPEQTAAAFLAGYTIGGGAWNNPKGRLRGRGLIEYRGDRLALTAAGRAVANQPAAPLTTEELQRRVMERLPGPERKLLQVLIDVYPEAITNEQLAERASYAPDGGAFNNPRGRLRSLGLAEYPSKGVVRATAVLFVS